MLIGIFVFFLVCGRFDLEHIADNIRWTMDEGVVNYDACGEYEDYKVINDWTHKWSEEELKTKVVEEGKK